MDMDMDAPGPGLPALAAALTNWVPSIPCRFPEEMIDFHPLPLPLFSFHSLCFFLFLVPAAQNGSLVGW